MTKVLWVIHGAEEYGERRAIISLMRGVRAAGWQAEAVSLTDAPCYQQIVSEGFSTTCLHQRNTPGMHLATNSFGKLGQFFKLLSHQVQVRRLVLAEIQKRRPDVVHVLSKNILPAVGWAAGKARVPCFWEMTAVIRGGFPLGLNRRIYRLLLDHYRLRALANSRYTAETLPHMRQPPEVMHLGADAAQFDPARKYPVTRAQLGIPEDALVYIIVSRIDASKGQHVFLQAARAVDDPRVHVVLVGDATIAADEDYARAMRDEFAGQAGSRVHFAGFSTEPQAYLAVADVGVNTRRDAEPFGLSVVEGMMMGKPALVHALGGPAETVVDGQTGWHVAESTQEGFASGIRRSLADWPRWGEMGAAARAHAVAQFSLERQTRRYQEIVSRVLPEKAAVRMNV